MPATIDIRHESLTYTAYFAQPTFSLWGRGGEVTKALYNAFSPYGVTLRNIQIAGHTPSAADNVFTMQFGTAVLNFSFEKVEVTFSGLSEEDLRKLPEYLELSTSWLKKIVSDLEFSGHAISYYQHSFLEGLKLEEVLANVNPKKTALPGLDLGSGAIFNRAIPDKSWTVQLIMDKSQAYPGALFLSFTIKIGASRVDYKSLFAEGMSFYTKVLKEFDLVSPNLPQ